MIRLSNGVFLLVLLTISTCLIAGPTHAEDPAAEPKCPNSAVSAQKDPAARAPGSYDWTGLYIGGSLGPAINTSKYTLTPSGNFVGEPGGSDNFNKAAFLGGIQLGYNYQIGSCILGLETDFKYDSYDSGPQPGGSGNFFHSVTDKTDYFGTVRGRLGYTLCDRLMVYGTGGLAYGLLSSTSSVNFLPSGEHFFGTVPKSLDGWTAGGGIEYALDRCWSVKLEYLFIDLGSKTYTFGNQTLPGFTYTTNLTTTEHAVQLGINYKFGSPGAEEHSSEGPPPPGSIPAARAPAVQADTEQDPAAEAPAAQAPAAQAPPDESWWQSFSSWQPQCPSWWPTEPWFPQFLGAQFNGVYQAVPNFHNPYQGVNSFSFVKELDHSGVESVGRSQDLTQTYGLYLGSQLTKNLQFYVDTEMFQGFGVSNGIGLGGYINGDVVRAGSANLPKDPYVARAYLRYICPLSTETEKVERAMDQIPGEQPVSRWEFKIGRFALTDDFDQNRYANNNRTQFMNYDFLFDTPWDYAADTRGYTNAVVAALYQPKWRLLFGIGMCPNRQNGANYDWFDKPSDMFRELGYQLEFDFKPNDCGTVIRLLGFLNTYRGGDYNTAISLGLATHTTPSILSVEGIGGTKYGFGLNFEQPLADNGDTGIFGRFGWNDGQHETWMYTEADRLLTVGGQLSGVHWQRADDRVGIAYGAGGLSAAHADYLALGGFGMLLGDGALNYNWEQVLEVYYSWQVTKFFAVTPDFQFIQNPGYNQDRGPVEVYGVRLRVAF